MFIWPKIINNKGITLIELLVSLSLTSLVLVIAFYVQLSASKSYIKWESKSRFADNARIISRSFINSITEGMEIINIDKTSITILKNDLKEHKLEFTPNGELIKNNQSLVPIDYRISSFEFSYLIEGDSNKSEWADFDQLDINQDMRLSRDELSPIKGVKLKYSLSGDKQSGDFESLAIMRKY
jgi:hypothetical protein